MKTLSTLFTAIVAALHAWFMTAEMFLWTHPIGRKMFGTSAAFAEQSSVLAANQGLYNGFLVAGLLWGMLAKKRDLVVFFLVCVVVAGIVGALTLKPTVFVVQSAPALLALGFLWAAGRRR